MHNAVVTRLELERDLRAAVENNEFELHLQVAWASRPCFDGRDARATSWKR